MINKVILLGNLGADPEVRHLESGSVVATFPVATNENYQDKSGQWQTVTEWHNVVTWRGNATRAERSLKKGSLVYLEGKITTRKWQDKEGNNRYTTEVVANLLRPLDSRTGKEEGEKYMHGADDENKSFPPSDSNVASESSERGSDMPDDDLPF